MQVLRTMRRHCVPWEWKVGRVGKVLMWLREDVRRSWDSNSSVRETREFVCRAVSSLEMYIKRTTLHAAGQKSWGKWEWGDPSGVHGCLGWHGGGLGRVRAGLVERRRYAGWRTRLPLGERGRGQCGVWAGERASSGWAGKARYERDYVETGKP